MVAAAPALDAPRGDMCKADVDEFRSMGESILEFYSTSKVLRPAERAAANRARARARA
jgi:hypothetical protein